MSRNRTSTCSRRFCSDKVFARVGGSIKVGKIHLTSTTHMDLPKVTLIKTTEVTRYDALVRLHVTSEKLGAFDVDVRMELALPVNEAGRFEHDIASIDVDHLVEQIDELTSSTSTWRRQVERAVDRLRAELDWQEADLRDLLGVDPVTGPGD